MFIVDNNTKFTVNNNEYKFVMLSIHEREINNNTYNYMSPFKLVVQLYAFKLENLNMR